MTAITPTPAPPATPATTAADTDQSLIIRLQQRPDETDIMAMPRGPERKAATWQALQGVAATSQQPIIAIAEQLKNDGAIAGYDTLVSPNAVVVHRADMSRRQVIEQFADQPGVLEIYHNGNRRRQWPGVGASASMNPDTPYWGFDVISEQSIEARPRRSSWGVAAMGAPEAWQQGATGEGLVFGSIDSGVDADHEALRHAYRGLQADGSVDHDYSWIDLSKNARRSPTPRDASSHGTHTIGSVVGRVGDINLGVAPDAKFVSVRALPARAVDLLRAFQWMQAPTRVDGSDADPTMAPDVVGNSWWSGNAGERLFEDSIRNLQLAGIEVVKSTGNRGPRAQTVTSPGQYPEITSIGATDRRGRIAKFSSRGPSPLPVDPPVAKPDFVAPGVDIVSTTPGNRYGKKSGTSMAQPHASGAMLAVLSKYPSLTHDQLRQALVAGAVDKGKVGHDSTYGHGIISMPRTLQAAALIVADQASLPGSDTAHDVAG